MELLSFLTVFLILFFIGMRLLQTGLHHFMNTKVEQWLTKGTNNIFISILTGTIATIFLQSSSVVLVITISLVTFGVLSFRQTIGIILGANIGTTVTGEILVFGDTFPFLTTLLVGAVFLIFPQKFLYYTGCVLVGISTIFVALNGFESLATLITNNHNIIEGFALTKTHPSIGILMGTIISGIIQSSSATFGLTLSVVEHQLLSLPGAIAIVLGSNIGTCVTSLIASIGTTKEAKLVAFAHTTFNAFTVLLALPLIPIFTWLAIQLASEVGVQLAHISVIFNIFSVLIVLPVLPLLERALAK